MPRAKPEKIIIEYQDGSKKSASFDSLPINLQSELMRQPFASSFNPNPKEDKFILLEWDDDWKEVIRVDSGCSDINRYYVISRPEDVGRLSINKDDGYPQLIEIIRKPLDLKRITFLDTYHLELERSDREGKKVDHFFSMKRDGNTISEIKKDIASAANEEGIDISKDNTLNSDKLREQYEKIRRKLGINAGWCQQDVYDFFAFLMNSEE